MKYPEPAIFELLKNLAAGKVYAMRAPQGETGPWFVFLIKEYKPGGALKKTSGLAPGCFEIF